MRKLAVNSDVLTGALFVVFGAGTGWISRAYPTGSLSAMGPGFFPTVLAWLLVGIGALLVIAGVRAAETVEPGAGPVNGRAVVLIPLAIAIFAMTIDGLGLVAASVLVTFIGGLAFGGVRVLPLAAFSVLLAGAMALVFVGLLGLQIRLWP